MQNVLLSHFTQDEEFTSEVDGIMFAFGITAYDSNQEIIEDPTYGTLNAYYKTWGLGEPGVNFEPLLTSQCTRAQLGLPEEDDDTESDYSVPPLFYDFHQNGINDVNFYYKKLKCIDKGAIRMQGDYNSGKHRSFFLSFEMCQSTEENPIECKTDEEIYDWLKRKFIFSVMNTRRFVLEEFDHSKKIRNEARVQWIPVNSQIREEIVFKITKTLLSLQDAIF